MAGPERVAEVDPSLVVEGGAPVVEAGTGAGAIAADAATEAEEQGASAEAIGRRLRARDDEAVVPEWAVGDAARARVDAPPDPLQAAPLVDLALVRGAAARTASALRLDRAARALRLDEAARRAARAWDGQAAPDDGDGVALDAARVAIRGAVAALGVEVVLCGFVLAALARDLSFVPTVEVLGWTLGFGLGAAAAWSVAEVAVHLGRRRPWRGLAVALVGGAALAALAPLGAAFEVVFIATRSSQAATRAALAAAGALGLAGTAWLVSGALLVYGPVLALRRRAPPIVQALAGLVGALAWGAAVVAVARPCLGALSLGGYALLLLPRAPLLVLGLRLGDAAAGLAGRPRRRGPAVDRLPAGGLARVLALGVVLVALAATAVLVTRGPPEQACTTLLRLWPASVAPATARAEAARLAPSNGVRVLPLRGGSPPPAPATLPGPFGGLGDLLRATGLGVPASQRRPTRARRGPEEGAWCHGLVLDLLRGAATRGDDAAAWDLVEVLEASGVDPSLGEDFPAERREALAWLRHLADAGDEAAEVDLTMRLLDGRPLEGSRRAVDEAGRSHAERTRDAEEGGVRLERLLASGGLEARRALLRFLQERPVFDRLRSPATLLRLLAGLGEAYAADDLGDTLARSIDLRRASDDPLLEAAARPADTPLPRLDVQAVLGHLAPTDAGQALRASAPRTEVARARAAAWAMLGAGPPDLAGRAAAHRALGLTDLLRALELERVREIDARLAAAHLRRAEALDPGSATTCLDLALASCLLALRAPGSPNAAASRALLVVAAALDPTLGPQVDRARATVEDRLASRLIRPVDREVVTADATRRLVAIAWARAARSVPDPRALVALDAAVRLAPACVEARAARAWLRGAAGDRAGAAEELRALGAR